MKRNLLLSMFVLLVLGFAGLLAAAWAALSMVIVSVFIGFLIFAIGLLTVKSHRLGKK